MQKTQIACPHCGSALNFGRDISAGTTVECLVCMRAFAAQPVAIPTPKASASPAPKPSAPPAPAAVKQAPVAVAATSPAQPAKASARSRSSAGPLIAVALVLFVLLAGGISFGVWRMLDTERPDPGDGKGPIALNPKPKGEPKKELPSPSKDANAGEKKDPIPEKPPAKEPPPKAKNQKKIEDDPEPDPAKDPLEGKKLLVRKDPPKPEPKDPEVTVPPPKKVDKPSVGKTKVDLAIDKGLELLRNKQFKDGSWGYGGGHPIGFTAICGLTLLESKVPAKDPAIARAADYVRSQANKVEKNYDAGAIILFLDRLGDPGDRPVIQSLALRILASQSADGGWSYPCAQLAPGDANQLSAFLQSHKKPLAKPAMKIEKLGPGLRGIPAVYNMGRPKGKQEFGRGPSDNSNTQFALLALWTARRHGVNTDQALLLAYDRLVRMQNADGGWGYETNRETSNGMTCVGLIGLAMGHAISPEPGDPVAGNPAKLKIKPALNDPRIKKGLETLSKYIGKAGGPNSNYLPSENLYFLWSLERVGMLYDVNTINGKDWYAWGAQLLLQGQGADGTFQSSQYINGEPILHTCFALLFLSRSNLVQDLTTELRFHSIVRDPR